MEQYDIWTADIPTLQNSHVQYGRRPVVIVSNNSANDHSPVIMAFLYHELRSVTPEARYELQTVPLMLSATLLYIIVIWKKLSQLMMLGGG